MLKVIRDFFLSLLRSVIGPDYSRHSLNQSDSKLITTWSPAFSRAWSSLVVLALSSHWLLRVFSFLLIGLWYHFSFGFAILLRKALYLVDYPFTFNYKFHTLTRPLCRKIHHVDRFLLPSFSPHSCLHQLLTWEDSKGLNSSHGPQRHLGGKWNKVGFASSIFIENNFQYWEFLQNRQKTGFQKQATSILTDTSFSYSLCIDIILALLDVKSFKRLTFTL